MINFSNTYTGLPSRFFARSTPAQFKNPKLISFNYQLASQLDLNMEEFGCEELAQVFSGQKILEGSDPIATAYAAHQFGHFVPQLGDGRAHLIGEVMGFDIQLKGSGQTQFSRNGDGRSALGPVVREYILSEAVHALGIPTTRALAAVATGEDVQRNIMEPGGVFTRVAPSHIRVGTFQYFACRQDIQGLETLLNYSIFRHYPHLKELKTLANKALGFIKAVGEAQASLIAKWMSYGFIHGVMNTDNYAVGGFTIDFGPCAFMDEYKENKVFSSIDKKSRYSYNNQVNIGQWNLLRLAECLLPLIDKEQESSANKVNEIITPILENFENKHWEAMALKFGISDYKLSDKALINNFLKYLEEAGLDFTLAFRNIDKLYYGDTSFYPASKKLDHFLLKWKSRVKELKNLSLVNPLFVPRNHQVQRAIEQANRGEYVILKELMEVLKTPFSENKKFTEYSTPPKVEERISKTFCGT